MSFLFGEAPTVKTSTNSTVSPLQQSILQQVAQYLQSGAPAPGSQPYPGTFAAPLDQLQSTSLAALEQQAMNVVTPQKYDTTQAGDTLSGVLTGKIGVPEQFNAQTVSPSSVTGTTIGPSAIDATQAFRTGVVEPLTSDFLSRTLPSIAGKYGQGAGGAYSTDALHARQQSATDLERVLAQQGSQFAYNAAASNQSAALTAAQANQRTDLTGQLANQAAGLQAGTANQSANLTAQNLGLQGHTTNVSAILQGLGLTPQFANLPNIQQQGQSQTIQQLLATLQAGSVPYNVAQTQVAGSYNDYLQQQQFTQQRLADAITAALGTTQQTTSVAQGGSTGLLQGLLPGVGQFAGSSAGSSLIASLIGSDRRIKDDLVKIGEANGMPVYRYRYKGEPANVVRIGLVAQDVEKRRPEAVFTRSDGIKFVDYAKALETAFAEAA